MMQIMAANSIIIEITKQHVELSSSSFVIFRLTLPISSALWLNP
jgi:hypothetical protein